MKRFMNAIEPLSTSYEMSGMIRTLIVLPVLRLQSSHRSAAPGLRTRHRGNTGDWSFEQGDNSESRMAHSRHQNADIGTAAL
jgi:hypothetical protein